MELDIFNPSGQLRRAIVFWLSTLIAVFLLTITAIKLSFFQIEYYNIIEGCLGFFSLAVSYLAYNENISNTLKTAYVYSLIIVTSLATKVYPMEFGIFLWTCLFPVVFYLILGRRCGALAIGTAFVVQVGILSYEVTNDDLTNNAQLVINFSLVFAAIWATSHVLEVKRRLSETSLGQLASRDALTGVYNRHALVHNYDHYKRAGSKLPLSLLILDLDYFKAVNDKFGHDVGDRVLVETATLIDGLSGEHLVYRIGGEEFCIALHDTGSNEARDKAEQLRQAIESYRFNNEENPIALTASIGVYYCNHFSNLESVLKAADKELYKAKKNGRNQVMVYCDDEQAQLHFI